jgi:hypothetical protein
MLNPPLSSRLGIGAGSEQSRVGGKQAASVL